MASLLAAVLVLAAMSSGFCEEKSFLQRAGVAFNSRQHTSLLTVSNGEQFGNWTWPEMCPDTFFAVGFSVRVEPNQYANDDTALNGIRLICAKDGNRRFLYTIESHAGYFGDWSQPQYCPTGVLSSFQIRVEPHQGLFGDDTAVNNIKFRCSSNPVLEAPGMDWGEYGPWSQVCQDGGICGIETKVEEYQYGLDDSSLNDVRFHCCANSQQSSFGDWSQPQYCPTGVLSSFQLRVEPSQGPLSDDTAGNNIQFHCSSGPTLEFPGMGWGEYGSWSKECKSGGLETNMEDYQFDSVDSNLNDVHFHCFAKSQQ